MLQQQHQQSGKSLKTFLKDAYASMYCVHHRKALHRPTQGIEMPNAMHCIRHRKALRWIRGKIREKKNRLYFADERQFMCQRKAIHPHMKRLSFFEHDSLRVVLKLCRVDFRPIVRICFCKNYPCVELSNQEQDIIVH